MSGSSAAYQPVLSSHDIESYTREVWRWLKSFASSIAPSTNVAMRYVPPAKPTDRASKARLNMAPI